ncbi:MAG: MJ0042-type zinc finger domain-containing protein [Isosphaeraceae bacterium]
MSESPMRFVMTCPNCLITLKVNDRFSGQFVRCKFCNHKFEALAPDFPPTVGPAESGADLSNIHSIGVENARIYVTCPNCSTLLKVRSSYAGNYVRCAKCQKKFMVSNTVEPPGWANPERPGYGLVKQPDGSLTLHQADQQLDGPARSDAQSEPENVRDVLARIHNGFRILQEDRARYRRERNTVVTLFKKLHRKYDLLKSKRVENRLELDRLTDELALVRQGLETSQADHQALRQEHERILTDLENLRADRDTLARQRDATEAQLQQLRVEREQLRSELDQAWQSHARLDAELTSVRESVGTRAAGELDKLRTEHELLQTEADRLREQVQVLRAELSDREHLAELLAQRDEEVRSTRLLSDGLGRKVQGVEAALADLQASRDDLNRQLREQHDQLGTVRAERDLLQEQMRGRTEALKAAEARLDVLTEQLRAREEDLGARLSDLERLADERQAAVHEAEGLRASLGQLQQDARHGEQQRVARIAELQRSLDEAEQQHRNERTQLAEQLRSARAQLGSEESRRQALETRIAELEDKLKQSRIDQRSVPEPDRFQPAPPLPSILQPKLPLPEDELVAAIAEVHVKGREQVRSVDHIKPHILTFTKPLIPPNGRPALAQQQAAIGVELEAARQEIAKLRGQLAAMAAAESETSSMLEEMGIRLQ